MPSYRIEWLDDARADVRRIDRPTAMRIFDGILHYARTGGGDYRVLFTLEKDVMQILGGLTSAGERSVSPAPVARRRGVRGASYTSW